MVEIVSPSNPRTDMVDKRREYELGGVPEYWIIDDEKPTNDFLQLNESGLYDPVTTRCQWCLLLTFVKWSVLVGRHLWRDHLPGIVETMQ